MGRQVKCRICNKRLDVNDAYKAVLYNSKGTSSNAYYCSEEHRKQGVRENQERVEKIKENQIIEDKVYNLICDIIGRKAITHSILARERNTWNKVATNEVLGKYLEENKNYLTNAIARLDNIEYNRIRYLSAIIKNNLGDYKPKVKEVEKIKVQVEVDLYEPQKSSTNKRRSLADLEDLL